MHLSEAMQLIKQQKDDQEWKRSSTKSLDSREQTVFLQECQSLYHDPLSLADLGTRIDANLCLLACVANGLAYQYVPKEYRNTELAKIAILSNPWALEYVDLKDLNIQLCQLALALNPGTYIHIPEQLVEFF